MSVSVTLLSLSLSDSFTKIGAVAAFVGIVGIALMAMLFFAEARELKRLRQWAEEEPARMVELERRVTETTALRIKRATAQPARPVSARVVPAAAASAATAVATQVATGVTEQVQEQVAATAAVGWLPAAPAVIAGRVPQAPVTQAPGAAVQEPRELQEQHDREPRSIPLAQPAAEVGAAQTPLAPPSADAPLSVEPSPAQVPSTQSSGQTSPAPPHVEEPAELEHGAQVLAGVGAVEAGIGAVEASAAPIAAPPGGAQPRPSVRPRSPLPPSPDGPERLDGSEPPGRPERQGRPERLERAERQGRPPRSAAQALPRVSGESLQARRRITARRGPPPGPPFLREEQKSSSRRPLLLGAGGLAVVVVAVVVLSTGGGGSKAPGSVTKTNGKVTHVAEVLSSPAETHVVVFNDTETSGLAHHVAANLRQSGYTLAAPLGGHPTGANTNTVVQYAPGYRVDAVHVAQTLGVSNVQPMEAATTAAVHGAPVAVVAGPDLAKTISTSTSSTGEGGASGGATSGGATNSESSSGNGESASGATGGESAAGGANGESAAGAVNGAANGESANGSGATGAGGSGATGGGSSENAGGNAP